MRANNKGFTLIEVLVALATLSITIPVVGNFLVGLQQKSYLNQLKAQTLSNISVLNSTVSGVIRNSYGISYTDSIIDGGDFDKLVLFNDKLETNKIVLFVKQDINADLSRIYIQLNGNDPVPLCSSHLFIEKFDLDFTKKPANTSMADVQPWVSFNIVARSRSPLEEPTEDSYYGSFDKTETSLYGRVLIRNYVPSSLK